MNSLHVYFGVLFAYCGIASVACNNDTTSSLDDVGWSDKAQIKIYPEQSIVHSQSSKPFVLMCEAFPEEGDFVTDIAWKDPSGNVMLEKFTTASKGVRVISKSLLMLTFNHPQVSDSGKYTCSAMFPNNATVKATIVVNFYDDIQFRHCSEQQSLVLGTSGEIICGVTGSHLSHIFWEKNGVPISSERYTVSEGKLAVSYVTEDDQGLYTVEALAPQTGRFKERTINVTIQYPSNEATCPPDLFPCMNGNCIRYRYVCNGFDDCDDGSDELNCTRTTSWCSVVEFRCANGRCIRWRDVCDRVNDCGDWSDEIGCPSPSTRTTRSTPRPCSFSEFRCDNGRCINHNYVCDRNNDCGDWSDERNCPSSSTPRWRTTPSRCSSREFLCSNGNCINLRYVCDGDNDCGDWSDERNCVSSNRPSCPVGMFACRNRRCIRANYVCNGNNDCGDFSDESVCNIARRSNYTKTGTNYGAIIGVVVGLCVLTLIFILTIWCVKIRKQKKKIGTSASAQPKTVGQTPQQHSEQFHAPQVVTQNGGSQDHASAPVFLQAPMSENVMQHHAVPHSSPELHQPPTSPEITKQHENLHLPVCPDQHPAPEPDIQQIPQSNLYPTLPEHAYPTAPENSPA